MLMSAVRQSYRNTIRTSDHEHAADEQRAVEVLQRHLDERRRPEDRRCRSSTSGRPGFSASIAASTSRVTCSVLPSGCFSTISSRPSPSLITASPIGGGKPSTTSATSPMRSALGRAGGAPRRHCSRAAAGRTMICRRSCGGGDGGDVRDRQPLLRRFEVAAGRHRRAFAGRGHDVGQRDVVGCAAGRDRRAPGAADRAGPRSRRWRRRESTSAAAGWSTAPASTAPSATGARTSCRSS